MSRECSSFNCFNRVGNFTRFCSKHQLEARGMNHYCGQEGCSNTKMLNSCYCYKHDQEIQQQKLDKLTKVNPELIVTGIKEAPQGKAKLSIAEKYPQYYKSVKDLEFIDVYGVHQLFDVQDSSGCIQHSSKKLLLSGVRTGGKTKYDDIKEARDTLTRWLELNPQSDK